jgi:hypothetical protein
VSELLQELPNRIAKLLADWGAPGLALAIVKVTELRTEEFPDRGFRRVPATSPG